MYASIQSYMIPGMRIPNFKIKKVKNGFTRYSEMKQGLNKRHGVIRLQLQFTKYIYTFTSYDVSPTHTLSNLMITWLVT